MTKVAPILDLHVCQKLHGPHAIGTPSQHELMVALLVMAVWLQSFTLQLCQNLKGPHAIGAPAHKSLWWCCK